MNGLSAEEVIKHFGNGLNSDESASVLYNVEIPTINEHIAKIFTEHEIELKATIRNFLIVQAEGSRQVARKREE